MPKLSKKISEPSILVKPVSKLGGLDNIHLALMALVIILILLVAVISYNTKITIVNYTNQTTSINATTFKAIHTPSQALSQAERILASYSNINSSISLLPYLANVNAANVFYLQNVRQWYVSIPYTGPQNGKTYLFSIIMNDSNLSRFSTFVQDVNPLAVTNNQVISRGVVKLYGQTSCTAPGGAVPVYWFLDPYAPGALQSLKNATALEQRFGSNVNVSIKILSTQYSVGIANTYGLNNTLQLGKYLYCASTQRNFTKFVTAVNTTYQDTYIPAYLLQELAGQSGLNTTVLNACVASAQGSINAQFEQARHYNITSSSSVLTSCEYISIPQTVQDAVCYSDPSICG
jgi:hypothetical protein